MTINEVINELNLKDDQIVIVRKLKENLTADKEYTAKELRGNKKRVAYVRQHYGGIKYHYNAVLILTEK